ncbi:MAG: hypothetical protein AAFQ89_15740 [Cyanobacteria bacterium J06626_18]
MPHQEPKVLQLPALELKFLLRRLQFFNYRTAIAQIRLNAKTATAERDRLCRQLRQKGLIDCDDAIVRFGLTAAGRTLLTLDRTVLPVTSDERLVLSSCQRGSITPGNIHPRVPKDQRQRLLTKLANQGLIRVTKRQMGNVWLTAEGARFLREDCAPMGTAPAVSWNLLSGYLQFMRQQPAGVTAVEDKQTAVTPETLLQTIVHLDSALNTENYLPIHHLRAKLQPPLSRRELDEQLYQLQRNDRIDLSTLQDVTHYRQEEVAAGIPQDIGGPLFFISVV